MRAEYEAIAVVGTSIGHVIALWASYFVAREIGRREEFNFCDYDCFVASGDCLWRLVFKLIGGYEESISWRMEDASFVEVRSARVVYQELKSRIRAQEGKEGVVIDEKRFRLWGCRRYEGGSSMWSVGDGAHEA